MTSGTKNSAMCEGGSLYCSKCGLDRPYCKCPDTHFNSNDITRD